MKNRPWRVLFLGTPQFAVPTLEALLAGGEDLLAVITQPDRPRGRGKKLSPPPVKELALSRGLRVLQPTHLKDPSLLATLRVLQPEIIVVVAYGRLLPADFLTLPSVACLNVHASLLPRYRGAAPVNWALIRGEEETGVTVMWMTAELDAGDIFLEERLAILPEDNAGTLAAKLAPRGAALMVEALNRLRRGQGSRQPQLQTGVTFAPPLSAEMRRLNWQLPAPAVAGWIRGLDPKPGAYALWQGRRLKLFGAKVKALTGPSDTPGRVLGILPAGLEIACGQGSIVVQELQMAGHKRLSAPEFLRGQALLEQTLE